MYHNSPTVNIYLDRNCGNYLSLERTEKYRFSRSELRILFFYLYGNSIVWTHFSYRKSS